MARFNFVVSEQEAGQRLDKFLADKLPTYSRVFLTKECHLSAGGVPAKPSHRVLAHEAVQVGVPPLKELSIKPEKIPLEILHEDADVLVIVKPAGMVVHPTDHGGHVTGTLVNALLHHLGNKSVDALVAARTPQKNLSSTNTQKLTDLRPGLVHRLDRDTSGVMVIAKTDLAKASLMKQFADRTVEKLYLALVVGRLPTNEGRIDAPIGRDDTDRTRRSVSTSADAREAVTEFVVLQRFTDATLVHVKILTGRTHQIRVHLSSIQHPIAGDTTYGSHKSNLKFTNLTRQFLHAERLTFTHPKTGARLTFQSPPPPDLVKTLESLTIPVV